MITVLAFFAFLYYFHKYNEIRRTRKKIFDRLNHLWIENQKLRTSVKELQSYKIDVSKTFKILDTELNLINEHIKTREETATNYNNISLLTPNILNTLMDNMNQEDVVLMQPLLEEQHSEIEEELHPFSSNLSQFFKTENEDLDDKQNVNTIVEDVINDMINTIVY